jgi:hypothetical protein
MIVRLPVFRARLVGINFSLFSLIFALQRFFNFSERGKATFSVGLYGKNEAFRLAVASRHTGLRDLGDIS